ncbi:hypothetical protein G9C98_008315 [Cotesia typhae]|uniref:non-specific serine/threonine protein kinase n=1 Tax=Cotesia typhae TaxID=2053667 RepID=A0A8J5R850_9HYME|nr:hypothetical protein G9C98_008315 [Cotesia typhae]
MWPTYIKQKISFILLFFITQNVIGDDNNHDIEPLRVCGSSTQDSPSSRLVFISTLDGKLTALDTLNNGEKKWSMDFDNVPLVSSSIHKRELNEDGHWVKLIPSLNGGLYKFNGDTVEQIPISTDQLLLSSFRYSDNLVFSGGKEIQTYGIVSNTGKLLYHCTSSGCNNNTDGDRLHNDVLIIQRVQQTIRAVEPTTGTEKWNYSVGTHELNLVVTEKPCHKHPGHHTNYENDNNIDIKVVIPQGLIWAVDKKNPSEILWRYQFDTPIVTVWQQTYDYSSNGHYYDTIKKLNLFDNKQWSWGQDYPINPSIYIGMYERQVYVQERNVDKFFELTDLIDNRKSIKNTKNQINNNNNNVYPWRPHSAHENAVLRIENNPENVEISSINVDDSTAAGLSILYNSDYIDGNGYYLYAKEQSNNYNNSTNNNLLNDNDAISMQDFGSKAEETAADNETSLETIIESLWVWWKEIMLLIIGTILLNILTQQLITSKFDNLRWGYSPPIIVKKYADPVTPLKDTTLVNYENNNVEFDSPYSARFETINCLGKGGYGVVFEAKNKIDDCHYAIKRISLPDTPTSRARVIREVKALAKLDHQNIVRYFHAWFECPPLGWQKQHDSSIKQLMSNSIFSSEDSCMESRPVRTITRNSNSVCIDVPISGLDLIDKEIESKSQLLTDNSFDDSFIVFDTDKYISTDQSDQVDDEDKDEDDKALEVNDNWKAEKSVSDSIVFQMSDLKDKNEDDDETDDENQKDVKIMKKTLGCNKKSAKMFFYIQMQLCQRLSLQDWLRNTSNSGRDRKEVINIFQQIVDAVEYVHLQGLIHRDLKPSNILFAHDNKIKIGDFGLVTARTEDDAVCVDDGNSDDDSSNENNLKVKKHTANVGTHLYMSPEQVNGVIYDYKVDIYSLGIILFELLFPFSTGMERITILGSLKKNIYPSDFAAKHPKEYDLLKMMLDKDPRKRPTAIGIKARPPLSNDQNKTDTKYHFALPHVSKHSSSISSSNSANSSELINSF